MTLLEKVSGNSQLAQVDKSLKSALEGLDVEIRVLGANARQWVQVSVSGEDETVALRYLTRSFGVCPTDLEEISRFSTFKGFMIDLARSRIEVWVDIGVSFPSDVDVAVPLDRLQAQLGDGRKIALSKLAELYGFCRNLPFSVRVSSVDAARRRVEAELSEGQLRLYEEWSRSLLDRLLVMGASVGEVRLAIRNSESARDVVGVESLGLFEHAVVCKLGTDAVGLIPRVGGELRRARFTVFSPRRVLGFFGEKYGLSIS